MSIYDCCISFDKLYFIAYYNHELYSGEEGDPKGLSSLLITDYISIAILE